MYAHRPAAGTGGGGGKIVAPDVPGHVGATGGKAQNDGVRGGWGGGRSGGEGWASGRLALDFALAAAKRLPNCGR